MREDFLRVTGNLLLIAGVYLLLFAGGLQVQIDYQRLAARGDNTLPVPRVAAPSGAVEAEKIQVPAAFTVPILGDGVQSQAEGSASQQLAVGVSTVSRLVISSIGVDSKVIEVGWKIEEREGGQAVAVWDVAEYAVGHHKGSANPGEGGNVVLAGHVGGYGLVFRDLFYVRPGDQVVVYSKGVQYLYVVQERLILDEEGVSLDQRVANGRYIQQIDEEVVTLVTCWPAAGPDKFTQRVVVRAVPYEMVQNESQMEEGARWTIR